MIKLTVGLPMYRSGKIGELSLESLCRQKNIDFEWELLIIEEPDSAMGPEKIATYSERLKNVGCSRLEYYRIKEWIPLSLKWYHLANKSSDTSKCFLLKAADCFSQPNRLMETANIFFDDPEIDWAQSKKGYFYDIASGEITLFNHDSCFMHTRNGKVPHPCALNMAVRTDLLKKLKPEHVKRSVDFYIFKELTELKGSPLKVGWTQTENWKFGLDTNGLNNISRERGEMIKNNTPPFEATEATLSDVVPEDIQDFIHKLRKEAITHEYII